MFKSVSARAPGKVNIALAIGPLRPDGFHDLASMFHAVNLFEEVTANRVFPRSGIAIGTIQGPQADLVPRDSTNLVWRAAALLAEHAGVAADVRLDIVKGIPVAGGMAGGSADAAAALVACNELWGTGLTRDELSGIGAELGSDIPFSLLGGTAQGYGRGERLTSLMTRGEFQWVFATSGEGLSTPAVYRKFDELNADHQVPDPRFPMEVVSALIHGDVARLGKALCNDLQPAALSLRPQLGVVLATGTQAGACGAIVSGSGPTVAFLVPDTEHGVEVAVALSSCEFVRSVLTTTGPAPGARISDST